MIKIPELSVGCGWHPEVPLTYMTFEENTYVFCPRCLTGHGLVDRGEESFEEINAMAKKMFPTGDTCGYGVAVWMNRANGIREAVNIFLHGEEWVNDVRKTKHPDSLELSDIIEYKVHNKQTNKQ